MDLLGSILDKMDKPPTLTENERMQAKKRKVEYDKRKAQEKELYKRFKADIEKKFESHFADPKNMYLKFGPMDSVYRSITHEIAESLGYLTYAFGTDGIDRYIRAYRKENPPCDDELAARRRGEPWNEQIKKDLEEKRKLQVLQDQEELKRKPQKIIPNTNYKDKYAHLIGQDAALDAARRTETNKAYGIVPSENKKDIRSIEQTMADIKAKKKLKTSHRDTTSNEVDEV